jgi:prolipoprotein diacylglyceryl transferase
MLLAALPQWTWDVDPVMWAPSKAPVVALIAAFGVISLLLGLKRKITDQVTTGGLFLAMAAILWLLVKDDTVELRYYSLLFVVVFLGGHALLNWQVKRGGGSPEVASDFIVYGVLGVLVGARLGHVLFYDFEHALKNPWWVFKIWTGGLASHGAVIGLILAMYLFCKKRGVAFLEGSDRFAFSATLGATVVRIGNLMNSEIVGRQVPDQSWGMRFPRFDNQVPLAEVPLRYPSQVFEILLGCFVFAGLFLADRLMGQERRPRGALISWFFILYFGGRMFTERFKEIEALDKNSMFTMGQYLSLPCFLLGIYGLWRAYKRAEPAGWVEPGDEPEEEDDEPGEEDEPEEEDEDADDDVGEDNKGGSKDADQDPDVAAEFEGGKLKKQRDPS